MNLLGVLEPVLAMAPAPMSAGLSARVLSVGELSVEQIVPGIRSAVTGVAGDAMAGKLGVASDRVLQAVGAGDALDGIADRGARAVDGAIADITSIASDCLNAVVQHVVNACAVPGPTSLIGGLGVAPIVEEHRLRAQQRLQDLGTELSGLTREIAAVELPAAPGAESLQRQPSGDSPGPAPGGSTPSSGVATAQEREVASDINTVAQGAEEVAGAPSPQAAAAVAAAKTALGTPYQWGGNVPGVGLDCSGLTQWAYAQAGVDIPRTADAQAVGAQVSMDNLAPGDLVVWDGHVAMAIGDGQMIEAGDPVQINPVRTDNIGMNFLGFYRPTA